MSERNPPPLNHINIRDQYPPSVFAEAAGPRHTRMEARALFASNENNNARTHFDHQLPVFAGSELAQNATASILEALLRKEREQKQQEGLAIANSLLQALQQSRQQQQRQQLLQVLNPILLDRVGLASNNIVSEIHDAPLPNLLRVPVLRDDTKAQANSEVRTTNLHQHHHQQQQDDIITIPCRARGMPSDHKFKASYIHIFFRYAIVLLGTTP